MIKLRSETEQTLPRRRRLPWLFVLLVLAAILALCIERWRGQWALRDWKRQMEAQGEILDLKRLWPPPSARGVEFSNQLAQAINQLPSGLAIYDGQLTGMVQEQPGQVRRGSQEPYLPMGRYGAVTNTWRALDLAVSQAQPALGSLQSLMKDPPPSMGCDILEALRSNSFPNFVCVRRGAQALHAAALNDLHKGDLAGALENLTTLTGFALVYEDDPTLVNFMIRIAIVGLSLDVLWDALQADGWTEAQLSALQQACQQDRLFLKQMPRSLEGERVGRLYDLAWFRGHSYQAWLDRYTEFFRCFNEKPSAGATGSLRWWREWAFHPIWKFAWADQEELIYLRTMQEQILILRQAISHGSFQTLNQQMAAHYQNYRSPVAAWRFYGVLPVLDEVSQTVGPSNASPAYYPGPMFMNAWSITMKHLTMHQMVSAVIALKRYELRHGQLPKNLGGLVPDFLAEAPRDFMDGQALRYRVNGDGSIALYSVGKDGKDDGGNPLPDASDQRPQNNDAWAGRDWVWPQISGAPNSPAS